MTLSGKSRGVVGLAVALSVLALGASCGSDKKEEDDDTPAAAVKYADISASITESCATANCHVSGSGDSTFWITNQADFDAKKTSIKAQLTADAMPKKETPEATKFTAAEKEAMLKYVSQ